MRNRFQKLQNRAACVITFSDYEADIGCVFELLRWQNLTHLQEIDKARMVYKSLQGLAPEYLCFRLTTRELAYDVRDSENKLCIPLPQTNYYTNYCFNYSGTILWNSLPCNVRQTFPLEIQTPQASALRYNFLLFKFFIL